MVLVTNMRYGTMAVPQFNSKMICSWLLLPLVLISVLFICFVWLLWSVGGGTCFFECRPVAIQGCLKKREQLDGLSSSEQILFWSFFGQLIIFGMGHHFVK